MAVTPGDPAHRAVPLTPLADDYGAALSDPLAGLRGEGGRRAGRSGMPPETVAAAVEAATERHGAALMAELGSRLLPGPDGTGGDEGVAPGSAGPEEAAGPGSTEASEGAEDDASEPRTRGQPVPGHRPPLPHTSPFRTIPSAVLAA